DSTFRPLREAGYGAERVTARFAHRRFGNVRLRDAASRIRSTPTPSSTGTRHATHSDTAVYKNHPDRYGVFVVGCPGSNQPARTQDSDDQPPEHREGGRRGRGADVRAASHHAGYPRGRVRHDHGPVGRGEVHAPRDPGHARPRLDGRILPPRPAGARAQAQAAHGVEPSEHRVRLPAVPLAGHADGGGEPGDPALVSERAAEGAGGAGRGHPGPVPDRGEEGPVPDAALGRAAAARGRGARGHRQAEADPRGRTDGEPALAAGARDHAALQAAEPGGDDDRAGHALGGERVVRRPDHPPEGRVDRGGGGGGEDEGDGGGVGEWCEGAAFGGGNGPRFARREAARGGGVNGETPTSDYPNPMASMDSLLQDLRYALRTL